MVLPNGAVWYKYFMADAPQSCVAVTFTVENKRYPFVGASRAESCRFELEELVHRGDGVYSEFFRVTGANPDHILDCAADHPQVDATLLGVDGDEAFFEFEVGGGCIAVTLAEAGAYPQVVRSDDGEGVVIVVSEGSERPLVRTIGEENTGVTLDAESRDLWALTTDAGVTFGTLFDVVSAQQRDVFLLALSRGFYDWPQAATLTEIADRLDLDESVLKSRLHRCEQLILAALFQDGTLSDDDTPTHPLVKPTT